jgi:hypothetical protein
MRRAVGWTHDEAVRTNRPSFQQAKWTRFFPPVNWLANYRLAWLSFDAIAGITPESNHVLTKSCTINIVCAQTPPGGGGGFELVRRRPPLRLGPYAVPQGLTCAKH